MTVDRALVDWVAEALAPVGTVTMRPMMGGATLYLDGTVFAIVVKGELWLKSDKAADGTWDAEGCDRFSYSYADGRVATMNYRRAPSDVYDEADALRRWAGLAHEAGLRSAAAKRPRSRGTR